MVNYHKELKSKLNQIKKVFNIDQVISIRPTPDSIANYYKVNKLAYTFFHRGNDFIHMGISRKNRYSKDDFLEQAKIVDKYIHKLKAKNVLELATGRGANSAYLAKKHSEITFEGIDLPHGQMDFAFNKSKKLNNFHPREGDYHDLSKYKNNSFDILFIIEALCHSNNKQKVFKEVKKILKKNGVFIITDGYSGKAESSMTKDELLAKELTEKGMFVPNFDYYPIFKMRLIKQGFSIIEEEDVSDLIIPTLKKIETQAKLYFSLPVFLIKLINKTFSPIFVNNLISGYLMITLVKLGIARYIVLVVKK